MTLIEFLQIAAPLLALAGVIFRVGQFTSKIDQRILKVESSLLARVAELRSELLLKVNDFTHNQELDNYRFQQHENQIKDLVSHLKDVEKVMEKTLGYARRPYSTFEDTQARRISPQPLQPDE